MSIRLLAPLKNRSFLFLWIAEVFSQIAMNMTNFILVLVIYSLTNSNTAVSGIVLCFTVPAIFFAIPAGAYVDRWNKKAVLFTSNFLRGLLLILLGIFYRSVVGIYIINFIVSIVTQFFIPAESPMIPLLVEKNELFSANALFGVALFGSVMFAYALSGSVINVFGNQKAIFFLGILFLLGAIPVLGIKHISKSIKRQKEISPTFMEEIKMTLKLIVKVNTIYHAFALLAVSQIIIFIIAVIGPGYAKNVLGIGINQFPALFVFPAIIGVGIGVVLLSTVFRNRNRQKLGTLGLFVTAMVLLLMPYGSNVSSKAFIQTLNTHLPHLLQITILHFMVVLACIMGAANAFIFVPSNTLIQEATSEENRGKVYGALNALISLLSVVPVILVGSLSDIIGVGAVLTIVGICIGVIGVVRVFIT